MFTSASATLKKCLLLVLFSGLTAGMLSAQSSPTPVIPRALPVEKEKSPGFLQRLFKKKPTPTPAPTATPKPTPARKRPKAPAEPENSRVPKDSATPTPASTPAPEPLKNIDPAITGSSLPSSLRPLVGGSVENNTPAESTPTPLTLAPPTPTPAEPSLDVRNNPLNQPIPLIDDSMALQITTESTPVDTENQRAQFQKVKAKALEDAKLRALKSKTETAATPMERYQTLKEYYPRLFASMRKIDETLSMQIDEMEAASRRRLDRMKDEELPKPAAK